MDKKVLMTGAAAAAVALVPGVAVAGPAVAAIVAALAKSQDEMKAAEAQGLVSLEDETRKQHLLMEYQSHQARVAQEVAIASRIETSDVVEIEEFYDQSGELGGKIGVALRRNR